MDRNEAKRILQAYHPGMPANGDPQLAEALALVERDPELAAWFKDQCSLHAALKSKLGEIPVPVDLKEKILARQKVVKPATWWRSRVAVAVAALVLITLIVGGLALRARTGSELNAYRKDMVQFVADLYRMNARADSWDGLKQVFAKQGWPSDYRVPERLRSVHIDGGCMTYWRENKVSMVCMKTADNKGLWMFVVERSALPNAERSHGPQFSKIGNLHTATWDSCHQTYLLATDGDAEELKKLL